MDTVTAMDRSNLGPFEAFMRAAESVAGEPVKGRELIRQPGETTIAPRPGLSEMDEFWGLFGIKPTDVYREQKVWEGIEKGQAGRMGDETARLRKEEPSYGVEGQPSP